MTLPGYPRPPRSSPMSYIHQALSVAKSVFLFLLYVIWDFHHFFFMYIPPTLSTHTHTPPTIYLQWTPTSSLSHTHAFRPQEVTPPPRSFSHHLEHPPFAPSTGITLKAEGLPYLSLSLHMHPSPPTSQPGSRHRSRTRQTH